MCEVRVGRCPQMGTQLGSFDAAETLTAWTEPNGVDYALSFQDPEGCAEVWHFIEEVQRHMNAIGESNLPAPACLSFAFTLSFFPYILCESNSIAQMTPNSPTTRPTTTTSFMKRPASTGPSQYEMTLSSTRSTIHTACGPSRTSCLHARLMTRHSTP